MKGVMFPPFWVEFISKNGLAGATVEVPEELDRSGLGVDSDGAAGPLYRIYHDSVGEGGYDPDHAVAVILQNYEELLGHVEDGQR
jgi:hypothetical protein